MDLFCGGGGAAVGYARAGWEVVGVDNVRQPAYPFPFIRDEWDHALYLLGDGFDAIHASPPCQKWGRLNRMKKREYPDLISDVRDALVRVGIPFIIENVPGAPLRDPLTLCGQMFGLRVLRHRCFETSFPIQVPEHPCHGDFIPFMSNGYWHKATEREYRAAMECEWMSIRTARQAIPPVFTEYIGTQLMNHLLLVTGGTL